MDDRDVYLGPPPSKNGTSMRSVSEELWEQLLDDLKEARQLAIRIMQERDNARGVVEWWGQVSVIEVEAREEAERERDEMQEALNDAQELYRRDSAAWHKLQDAWADVRDSLQSELAELKCRQCRTCDYWRSVSGVTNSDEGLCEMLDRIVDLDIFSCSEWEPRREVTK